MSVIPLVTNLWKTLTRSAHVRYRRSDN